VKLCLYTVCIVQWTVHSDLCIQIDDCAPLFWARNFSTEIMKTVFICEFLFSTWPLTEGCLIFWSNNAPHALHKKCVENLFPIYIYCTVQYMYTVGAGYNSYKNYSLLFSWECFSKKRRNIQYYYYEFPTWYILKQYKFSRAHNASLVLFINLYRTDSSTLYFHQ
jgi:hypothetical protein